MSFQHVVRTEGETTEHKDRRFTLHRLMGRALAIARVRAFDLDAAAEPLSHHAPLWYGPLGTPGVGGCVGLDGLAGPWAPVTFCNPPWSKKGDWVAKAGQEYLAGRCRTIVMVLPAATDQVWWHTYVEPHRDLIDGPLTTHFFPREPYGNPEDPTGLHAGSPKFASCILLWSTQ